MYYVTMNMYPSPDCIRICILQHGFVLLTPSSLRNYESLHLVHVDTGLLPVHVRMQLSVLLIFVKLATTKASCCKYSLSTLEFSVSTTKLRLAFVSYAHSSL